ncbi:MAG: PA2169 family four-helix-bundle protein [Flavobacteriaceae bacterium]|uniref:PA2169 family four-helix-bundle protein n=1 Tax=Flavobacterium kayseriense TaxID=2764714 RepID=A0ABR7J377_9FLAO|nr:PA2169 family four-helix-bundle protein [Flavobacterium kayseriense]MBC5840019.1 PA2169 family four-helix-bundle protein [Flavobacterium kayseriense]MBC5847311.1 PA2169 family four-helix-bundle protein [Flavobacterium kayseriense]MBX9887754.1 PA2169 family four-helix-bundle protein [Flavobacteriaceae bacterium]
MTNTDEKREKVVSTLEGLIQILEDGKLGYTNAAEHVGSAPIKSDFIQFARERALYIVELQDEINRLGKTTDASGGGVLGAIHRAWIDIKSSFTSGDVEAIANACITGEESAIASYETALDIEELGADQIALISKQLTGIKSALLTIKAKKLN